MKHLLGNFPGFVSIAFCIYTALTASESGMRAAFAALACVIFTDIASRRRDDRLEDRMRTMQDEINHLHRELNK